MGNNYKLKHEENRGKGKHGGEGKGWSVKAAAHHATRLKHISQRMSTSEYSTFRPRRHLEIHYWVIRDWGAEDVPALQQQAGYKDSGVAFSALFNSLLEGLAESVKNTTQIDADGNISIEVNLGRIIIK